MYLTSKYTSMTLSTAVIGAGTVSDVHLSGLKKCPKTELVGVCDLDETRAREQADAYGTKAYTDVDRLIGAEDPDWIHVCTPVQTHLPVAKTVIEAGIPVLIEKPVAPDRETFEELVEFADAHGVRFSVVHNFTFGPSIRRVKSCIESGRLGSIRGVTLRYAGLSRPGDANRGEWAFDLSGGEFEEGLPHPLYVTLATGGHPRSADDVSVTTSLVDSYDRPFNYDNAQLQYVTDDGVLCSAVMLSGDTQERAIHVQGTDGCLTVDHTSHTIEFVEGSYSGAVGPVMNTATRSTARVTDTARNVFRVAKRAMDEDDWEAARDINGHYYQFDAEAEALLTGGEPAISVDQIRWTTELLDLVRDEAGRSLELPERTA